MGFLSKTEGEVVHRRFQMRKKLFAIGEDFWIEDDQGQKVFRVDGKKIHVVALLTDNVNKGLQTPAFRTRYETLSTRADFIVYNGHAGLGSNIRALAAAGKWVAGQYVVVFMNGCDTFAYIDNSLSAAHKAINPDDTTGFKYIDVVNNGMPAFFAPMAGDTMALFGGSPSTRTCP